MKTTRQAQVTFVTLLVLFLSLLIGDGFAERGPVAAKLDANEYAGLGRMFGFKFLENFNYPYVANSITGFWRRWHMSLSSWFRDYLYIPLGGNRGSAAKTYRNLFIVFLLCVLRCRAAAAFFVRTFETVSIFLDLNLDRSLFTIFKSFCSSVVINGQNV